MKKINNNKGFTLVELLIVVAIIAILAAIAIPVYSAQMESVRFDADTSVLRTAASLAATDYMLNGSTLTHDSSTPPRVKYYIDVESATTSTTVAMNNVSISTTAGTDPGGHTWKPQSKAYIAHQSGLIIAMTEEGKIVLEKVPDDYLDETL